MCFLWQLTLPRKHLIKIDPVGLHGQHEPIDDTPCYSPRGDFLIGLAKEALYVTKRRKLMKEIALLKSVLKGHEDKPMTRHIKQLKNRLERLINALNNTP